MKKSKRNKQFLKVLVTSLSLLTIILLAVVISLVLSQKDADANPVVVLETNKGNIIIELYPQKAPKTVENFLAYTKEGFYENTVFHRVIDNFMIQGGGFDTSGAQKQTKDPIPIESNNSLKNDYATVAMARTNDPNSATSQFFININNNTFLNYKDDANPGYAVFGKVIEGMDIVEEIKSVETKTNGYHKDWPVEDIIIKKAYLQ